MKNEIRNSCVFLAALLLVNTCVNAAEPEKHAMQQKCHTRLTKVCDPYLKGTPFYCEEKLTCGRAGGTSTTSLEASTLYELTLRIEAPLSALEEALKFCTDGRSIIQAFCTVWCYKKGHISTEKELFLKRHARISLQGVDTPLTRILQLNFSRWINVWPDDKRTQTAYSRCFVGGTKTLPLTEEIGAQHEKRYGHFSPEHFLKKALVDPLIFIHFEEEHARALTYAFLPMFCDAEKRRLLDTVMSKCTDPDQTFLVHLSAKAQELCEEHEKTPDTCDTTRILLQEIKALVAEQAQNPSQETWKEAEETCNTIIFTTIAGSATQRIAKKITEETMKTRKIASDAKAESIANLIMDMKNDEITPNAIKKVIDSHRIILSPEQIEIIKAAAIEEKEKKGQCLLSELAQKIYASVHEQQGGPCIPERQLEGIVQKLRKASRIPYRHSTFFNGIWAIFNELRVNVSLHQWEGSKRLLRKLPWLSVFAKSNPQEAEVLLAYRLKPLWPKQPYTKRIDYFKRFLAEGICITKQEQSETN